MPKVTVYYTITNDGSGEAHVNFLEDQEAAELAVEIEDQQSEPIQNNDVHCEELEFDDVTGKLLNPESTKAELRQRLAEMRDEEAEDEDSESLTAPQGIATDTMPATVQVYYTISNMGSGEACVYFHEDEEAAELAVEIEDEGGEPIANNEVHCEELKFDQNGKLTNPDQTKEELRAELAELRNENAEDEDEENLAETFQQATAPAAPPEYNLSPESKQYLRELWNKISSDGNSPDLTGKTVVFTGRLSTMTRADAEKIAQAHGATVSDSVSKKTDLLVIGQDAGSKLDKARALGIAIITEAEWNEKLAATPEFQPAAKPPTTKIKIIYTLSNNGDGSASVHFHANEETAQMAVDLEEESGEPFCENYVYHKELTFDENGILLNPSDDPKELRERLAEVRRENGEEDGNDDDENEDSQPLTHTFQQTATPPPTTTPPMVLSDKTKQILKDILDGKDSPTPSGTEPLDLTGKTVVFTGKLSTMTRADAAKIAQAHGAIVSDSVSKNTDLLVVGEDAGSKLEKAKDLGVTVLTEAEWNKKIAGGPKL